MDSKSEKNESKTFFNFRSCGDGEGRGRIVCRKFLETDSIQTQFYRAFPQSRGKKPVSSDSALLRKKATERRATHRISGSRRRMLATEQTVDMSRCTSTTGLRRWLGASHDKR